MKALPLWLLCLLTLLGTTIGTVSAGHAQAPSAVSELDIDLRARVAAVGASGTKLYTTSLRTERTLAPGLRVQFYGTHRYEIYGIQQATIEKEWGGMAGQAQVGIVRLPFGIYNPRETYGSGLIDYPLQVEVAGFSGRGTEIWDNTGQVRGGAVRAQTYTGDAIFGLSRWDGAVQNGPTSSRTQPVHMTGLDLRYTKTQLLLRGEYLFGTLSGSQMTGWYLDAYYRLPQQEHWSLVGRVEALKPGSSSAEGRQLTLGVRDVIAPDWTLALNWRHNNGPGYGQYWTPSALKGGDILLQAYHRIGW
jgi:hypothetical protein